MYSPISLTLLCVVLTFGFSKGVVLTTVPATTLAFSSPLVSRSILPLQYSSYPLAYSGYTNLASPYVAAPVYYKYALPSYFQAVPSVYANPARTILEPAAVGPVAEESPEAKVASPEIKENNDSEVQTSDESATQEQ